MTAALAALALLLAVALAVAVLLWRAAVLDVRELQRTIRRQCATPTAYAALRPDAEPPVPAGWLDDLHNLPTTHDREYPR